VSAGYTAEWGTPASATRYSKLRAVLSTFIENAMRRRIDMSVAIAEWQQDLVYIGQFRIT
jgi:hypothetical protein